MVMVYKFITWG